MTLQYIDSLKSSVTFKSQCSDADVTTGPAIVFPHWMRYLSRMMHNIGRRWIQATTKLKGKPSHFPKVFHFQLPVLSPFLSVAQCVL
uniref:Mads box protein n=1 Tax=Rhizophora mucronata TaxID=61149 RepID=A0A2P2LAZ2_RHIMU